MHLPSYVRVFFSVPYQANLTPTTHTPSREACHSIVGRSHPLNITPVETSSGFRGICVIQLTLRGHEVKTYTFAVPLTVNVGVIQLTFRGYEVKTHAFVVPLEGFNDWGGRGYDDFVPGEVTKTAPSGDKTA